MKRTLWKWSAPAVVLATVTVWGWAQETKPPVPAEKPPVELPAAGGAGGAPGNPNTLGSGGSGYPGDGSSAPDAFGGADLGGRGAGGTPLDYTGAGGGGTPVGVEGPNPLPEPSPFRQVDVVDSEGKRGQMFIPRNATIGQTLIVQDESGRRTLTVVADPYAPGGALYGGGLAGSIPGGSSGGGASAGMGAGTGVTPLGGVPGMMSGGGPPGFIDPGVKYRAVETRHTVTQVKMVPMSPQEIGEVKLYQAVMQALQSGKTDAEKELGRKQLGELLEKQFNRDFETREKDVVELETRVKKLREQLDKRKAAKEKIIELRLTTILNSLDGLGFPEASGAGIGTGAEIFSSGAPLAPGELAPPVGSGGLDDESLPGASGSQRYPGAGGAATVPSRYEPVDPATTRLQKPFPNGNLITTNWNFDDGPRDWGTGAAPPTVEYTIDGKGGLDGSPAARIHKTENKYFPISEWTYRIDNGTDPNATAKFIELSAMVKTKDARKAVLDVLFLDDKGEWIKHEWAAYIGDPSNDPQPLTHDFKEYKGTVAIPPNTKTIVIGLQNYGPGDIWFDNVGAEYREEAPKEPNNVPK